jgi:hypothetical protein
MSGQDNQFEADLASAGFCPERGRGSSPAFETENQLCNWPEISSSTAGVTAT